MPGASTPTFDRRPQPHSQSEREVTLNNLTNYKRGLINEYSRSLPTDSGRPGSKTRDLDSFRSRDVDNFRSRDLENLRSRDADNFRSRDLDNARTRDLDSFRSRSPYHGDNTTSSRSPHSENYNSPQSRSSHHDNLRSPSTEGFKDRYSSDLRSKGKTSSLSEQYNASLLDSYRGSPSENLRSPVQSDQRRSPYSDHAKSYSTDSRSHNTDSRSYNSDTRSYNTDSKHAYYNNSDRHGVNGSERARSSLSDSKKANPFSKVGLKKEKHFDLEDEDEEDARRKPPPSQKAAAAAKKKKKKSPITANLGGTRYDVVRRVSEKLGMTVAKDDDPTAYLIWNDSFVSTERISDMKPYQRINHFPGMGEICRKDCLARNMAKMSRIHPEEFGFVPKTWILPSEYSILQNYARELKKKKKNKTFIVKPANGAMGNGIGLYRNAEKIPQNDHFIVQEYLDKPLLVDGYKCDMRIYVLVTSCDPLRVFLFNDGLLRLATEKYIHPSDSNVDELFMHLTNYSVNKHSDNYDKSSNVETGSKRTLKFFNDYLRRHDYDVQFLWRNITDMIVKTMVVAHPHVLHAYRMCRPGQGPTQDSVCFEILGFDVMVDKKLRPWLLEINRSPSFGTDEQLDLEIKSAVIEDAIRLLNIKASDKRKNIAAQKAEAQRRLLRPNKRVDNDMSELDKKRQSVERKKEELKDLLTRLKKDAVREDFENRNSGRFRRIFPPEDKFRREKYAGYLSDAFGTFLSGRAGSLQKEIDRTYNNRLREEDILDMLAQCEADERDGKAVTSNRPPRGPKGELLPMVNATPRLVTQNSHRSPLSSMPTLSRDKSGDDDDDDDDDDEDYEDDDAAPRRPKSRPVSGSRPVSKTGSARPLSVRPGSGQILDEAAAKLSQKEKEEENVKATLLALNDMRIKFPGKTDDEAEYILDKLHENWKFHKPRIASYWLVKLDSIKRRKVIDIVRSNVRAVLQRTWKTADVDSLRLYRIFQRVFNRLLWSHGQGLWNCFQTSGNSWETIFSKSSETISPTEMACCRRIVQLCRDCLLIVYQFAAEAKGNNAPPSTESDVVKTRAPLHSERVISGAPSSNNWGSTPQTLSQRLSRLYNGHRSHSLNSLNGHV